MLIGLFGAKANMRIIFLSLVQIDSLNDQSIYHDLLRTFFEEGHSLTIVCPVERRTGISTRMIKKPGIHILQVKTLNLQKTNLLEKGLAIISLNYLFKRAIKSHLSNNSFDLILYTTPPITLTGLIEYLKNNNKAKTYLLLKDIFPQNAVDMGMIRKNGFIHQYFSRQEKKLYKLSDRIGCMSLANIDYIKYHNPEIPDSILEVNPNSVDLTRIEKIRIDKKDVLDRFGIPLNKVLFLYGGNLGKPQGLSFLLLLIKESAIACIQAHFVIVGNGTEYSMLSDWFSKYAPRNATLIKALPKNQYDELASCCDVGLILLHPNFTIPNFPSRILTYMAYKMPVICMTDSVTDIGPIAEKYNFGKWCLNGDLRRSVQLVITFATSKDYRTAMGQNGYDYLFNNCNVKFGYQKIISLFKSD